MHRRTLDLAAIVLLPILTIIVLIWGGGWVDPCLYLGPNPNCRVHEALVPPAVAIVPAAILWVAALVDLVRTVRSGSPRSRRTDRAGRRRPRRETPPRR